MREVRGWIIFHVYQNSYLIITIFLGLGILLPIVALFLGKLLRPHKPDEIKYATYESGIEPFSDSRVQFHVRYYIFALMFVIFDVRDRVFVSLGRCL